MKLYHGTNRDFEKIDLQKSKPNKDFGRGFYLSADYEQALSMAQVKVEQLDFGTPIVQVYIMDDSAWEKLHVLRFEDYSEEWAKFILRNRNNSTNVPTHEYDVETVQSLTPGVVYSWCALRILPLACPH